MEVGSDLLVHTHRIDPTAQEACTGWWTCKVMAVLSDLVLLLTIGVLSLVVVAVLAHLRRARSIVDEERSRATTELDAFTAFAQRISDLPLDPPPQPTSPSRGTAALASNQSPPALQRVRDAYRETVMATPHYDEEYGEALLTNFAEEFGGDVAGALDTNTHFTPQLKGLLVAKAYETVTRREKLLAALDREAKALANADETYRIVETQVAELDSTSPEQGTYDGLTARMATCDQLEDKVESILTERQNHIHEEPLSDLGKSHPGLLDYLYQPLPVSYPVLSTGTALIDRLHSVRADIERAVVRLAYIEH